MILFIFFTFIFLKSISAANGYLRFFFLPSMWDLPWPDIKYMPPEVEVKYLNHWITREILRIFCFKNVYIFNWRIIAFQYCVGLWHTLTWICHSYTYVLSLLNLPPMPTVPSLMVVTEHLIWAPCIIQKTSIGYLTQSNVYVSMLVSQFVPHSPSPTVSTSLFSMCVSLLLPCI